MQSNLKLLCFSLIFIGVTAFSSHSKPAPKKSSRPVAPPITVDIVQLGYGPETSKKQASVINKESNATKSRLLSFLDDADYKKKGIEKLLFFKRVLIDPNATPYTDSYTRTIRINNSPLYRTPPERLLTLFIHEQMHAFLFDKGDALERALAEFRRRGFFDGIPNPAFLKDEKGNFPPHARAEMETHMVVNWLELNLGAEFVGRGLSEEMLRKDPIYPELNARIFEKEKDIKAILEKEGLIPALK